MLLSWTLLTVAQGHQVAAHDLEVVGAGRGAGDPLDGVERGDLRPRRGGDRLGEVRLDERLLVDRGHAGGRHQVADRLEGSSTGLALRRDAGDAALLEAVM